jgi:hypothetical protein
MATLKSGSGLVKRTTALDRSTAPVAEQLKEAADLIDVKFPKDDDLLRGFVHGASKSDYGSKEEWILRWFLKRLREATTIALTNECMITSPQAWSLLQGLILNLPTKAIAKSLQKNSLVTLLDQALQWLQVELRKYEQLYGDGAYRSPNSDNQQKLRDKRYRGDNQSSETLYIDHLCALLISIGGFLEALRNKISSSKDFHAFAAENIKFSVQCESETAIRIIGAGLNCVSCMRLHPHVSILTESLVKSFLLIYSARDRPVQDDVSLLEAVSVWVCDLLTLAYFSSKQFQHMPYYHY